ncbi:MAG: hypothetical protein IPK80_20530 [Nannocystis sp.]|nr:hypothetical protein [Nannocystis sp.]
MEEGLVEAEIVALGGIGGLGDGGGEGAFVLEHAEIERLGAVRAVEGEGGDPAVEGAPAAAGVVVDVDAEAAGEIFGVEELVAAVAALQGVLEGAAALELAVEATCSIGQADREASRTEGGRGGALCGAEAAALGGLHGGLDVADELEGGAVDVDLGELDARAGEVDEAAAAL